jgi:hypothetical protein
MVPSTRFETCSALVEARGCCWGMELESNLRPRPFGLIAEQEPGLREAGQPRTASRRKPTPATASPFRAAAAGDHAVGNTD